MWHESIVQIFEVADEPTPDPPPSNIVGVTRPQVSIVVPPVNCVAKTRAIKDICSAIEDGKTNQEHVAFALTEDRKMGKPTALNLGLTGSQVKSAVKLRDLLSSVSQRSGQSVTLSWSIKTSLAVNVASSFLQLLRTPWTTPRLSTETMTLLQASNQEPDMTKPLLSVSFDSTPALAPVQNTDFEVKDALVELGIMLLEIWHGRTLEEKFGLGAQPLRPFIRRGHAFEWLESLPGNLPGLYHTAVLHCLVGAMNSTPLPKGWDDMCLWETMCESVIEPLSKLAKS